MKISANIRKINDLRELPPPFSPRSDTKLKRSRTDARIRTCVVFTHQPTRFQPLAFFLQFPALCKMSKNTRPSAITTPYYHTVVGMQVRILRWSDGERGGSARWRPSDVYPLSFPFLRYLGWLLFKAFSFLTEGNEGRMSQIERGEVCAKRRSLFEGFANLYRYLGLSGGAIIASVLRT
jgi:hypothetical protein